MDNCIVFAGRISKQGYGKVCLDGKDRFAHRIAWMWANGGDPIPAGMCVCHKCDNPPCINPEHLFLGTQADNVRDMLSKGRAARGFSLPQTKLSDEAISMLRAEYANGVTHEALGKKFGISAPYVSALIRGAKRAAGAVQTADIAETSHANRSRRTAKVTREQVLEMREAFSDHGESQSSIARRYGMHSSSVSRLVRGLTWGIVK